MPEADRGGEREVREEPGSETWSGRQGDAISLSRLWPHAQQAPGGCSLSSGANELVRGWPGPLDPGPPAGRLSFTKGAPTLRRALVPATRGDKGASDPVGAVDDDHPNPFV